MPNTIWLCLRKAYELGYLCTLKTDTRLVCLNVMPVAFYNHLYVSWSWNAGIRAINPACYGTNAKGHLVFVWEIPPVSDRRTVFHACLTLLLIISDCLNICQAVCLKLTESFNPLQHMLNQNLSLLCFHQNMLTCKNPPLFSIFVKTN